MTLKLPSEYQSAEDLPEPLRKRDPSGRRRWNLFWDFLSPCPDRYITVTEHVCQPWSKVNRIVRGTILRLTLDLAQEREALIRAEVSIPSTAGVTA